MRVAKGLSCDINGKKKILLVNPTLRYRAEKRRDHGNLRGRTANSVVPTLLSSISLGRGGGGGGGFTGRNFVFTVYITAKAFSYPHTEFGALRSRRLALKCVTNEEVDFFSDPCVFGYIF